MTVKSRTPLALAVVAALSLTGACRGESGRQRQAEDSDLATATQLSSEQTMSTSSSPTPTVGGGGVVLVLIVQDIRLDKVSLTAPPGAVTIRFENRDNGLPHNFHLFARPDVHGADLAQTNISAGPTTTTLTVDLPVGRYFYQCDVHPTVMNGLLTVATGMGPVAVGTPLP